MRGEKYGFAVVFFDSTGERTFALPIPNAEDFQMPNRRDIANTDVLDSVRKGTTPTSRKPVYAATVNGFHSGGTNTDGRL